MIKIIIIKKLIESKRNNKEVINLLEEIREYLQNKLDVTISDIKIKRFGDESSIIEFKCDKKRYCMVFPAIRYLLSIVPSTRKLLYDRAAAYLWVL